MIELEKIMVTKHPTRYLLEDWKIEYSDEVECLNTPEEWNEIKEKLNVKL